MATVPLIFGPPSLNESRRGSGRVLAADDDDDDDKQGTLHFNLGKIPPATYSPPYGKFAIAMVHKKRP